MIRESILSLSLWMPLCAGAAEAIVPIRAPIPAPAAQGAAGSAASTASATPAPVAAPAPAPAPAETAPATRAAGALPPMYFLSSVLQDELFAALKADPGFAALDKELVGSPLTLIVTHTLRPTAGGQAAGLLSAVLAGSTLGLIPVVSSERLVLKYEVRLNGRALASYSFERTAARAQNMWMAGSGSDGGLGKAGVEWAKSTAAEAAAKLAKDPAILAVSRDIDFYFPATAVADRR